MDLPNNIDEDEDGFEEIRAQRRADYIGPISRMMQQTKPATDVRRARIQRRQEPDDESDEDEPENTSSKKNSDNSITGMATAALGSLASGAASGIAKSLFGGLSSVANTYIKEAKEGVRAKEAREDELKKLQLQSQLSAAERRALMQEEERRAASQYARHKSQRDEGLEYARKRFQTRLELQKEYDKYLAQLQKENKEYYETKYAGARRRNSRAYKKERYYEPEFELDEPEEPDDADEEEPERAPLPEAQYPSPYPRGGRLKKKKNPPRYKPQRRALTDGDDDGY